MKSTLEVTEYNIEKDRLFIKIQGFFNKSKAKKIRLTVIFQNGEQNRRFPLEADCFHSIKQNGSFFVGKGEISLPDVFYFREGEVLQQLETAVFVEAFNGRERMVLEKTGIFLPKNLFLKKQKKKSFWFSCYRLVAAIVCISLLPLFLLDGLFAVKGYKTLDTGENRAGGLKGILLHANALTRRICGFAYSLREIKTEYLKCCYKQYCKRPIQKDNLLLLSERLLEENSNMARIKEAVSKEPDISITEFIHVKPVNKLTFQEIRESAKKMAAARCILLEDFYPQLHSLSIRKETKVVQLWHACGAYKTFGFSRLGKPGGPKEDSKNHRNYDYTIVSGKNIVPVYSEAFGIPEQRVKNFGVPRTDIFFEEGYRETVRERLFQKYPLLSGKKVILFAPTFRGDGNKDAYYPVDKIDWNLFFEHVPENYFVILKNHPFVKQTYSYDAKWEDRVLGLTGKDNMNDLLFITDLLITDYSSSVFEAALLNIPMVFYVFDKEEYMESRDIYYDFDTFVPGEQVKTQEDLVEAVLDAMDGKRETEEQICEKYEWFRNEFLDGLSGNSTKNVARLIVDIIRNQEK